MDQEQKKQMLSDYYTGALDAARGDNHHSIKLLCVQDTDEKLIREIAEISFQIVYKWILKNLFCPMRILFVSDNHEVYINLSNIDLSLIILEIGRDVRKDEFEKVGEFVNRLEAMLNLYI